MEFHELDSNSFHRVETVCSRYVGESCELAFANLLFYAKPSHTEWAELPDGGLLLRFGAEKVILPPLNTPEPPPSVLAELAREADAEVYDVAPGYPERFPDCGVFFEVISDPGEADYLYRAEKLVENGGSKLRKKRNLIRQFDELYPDFHVESITTETIDDVVRFAEELNTRLVQAEFLTEENAAMERAAQTFAMAGLHGVLLFASGRPAGFSLFSRIGVSDVWDVHFEKADHEFKGAPQKLTQAAAQEILLLGGQFMNREQDMNEPGLRHAKESLDPDHRYERLRLRLKSN